VLNTKLIENRFQTCRQIFSRADPNFSADLDKAEHSQPLVIMADLVSSSHLDFTESTKRQHCGSTYQWPVTKKLKKLGLTDAYRQVKPNPLKHPGNTWSTVIKESGDKKEPQVTVVFQTKFLY